MNYRQADPTKETSCKECIFAVYNNITQVDCLHGRISKYGEKAVEVYDDEKEYFIIESFCGLKRLKSWNEGKPDIVKSRQESAYTFDIVVNINNLDENIYNNFKNALEKINYPIDKYYVQCVRTSYISTDDQKTIEKISDILKIAVNKIYDDSGLNTLCKKYRGSYSIYVDINNFDDIENMLLKIDNVINDELKKAIIFKHKNIYSISNLALKLVYKDLYSNYQENIKQLIEYADEQNLYIEI